MLHRQGQPGEDSHEDVQVSGVLRVLPATTPRRRERYRRRRVTRGGLRALGGAEAVHAAQALAQKYPLLQGTLIPLYHRLRGYRTVHVELTPTDR